MFASILTFFGIAAATFAIGVEEREDITGNLTVENGAAWGDWGPAEFCPEGEYAIGYRLKIQEYQLLGDDTALNGVMLFCAGVKLDTNITSTVGHRGEWGPRATCHQNLEHQLMYIRAFVLQVEKDQHSFDDTAANWIKFKCGAADETVGSEELTVDPGHGSFGDFGHWSDSCAEGSAVCGLQTKVEPDRSEEDDTTLNNVMLFCCTVEPIMIGEESVG